MNTVAYCDTRSRSRSYSGASSDDSIEHFDFFRGQEITTRYLVEKKLGDGTFGRVLQCYDRKYRDTVAVKVIRDVDRYVENARVEAQILRRLFKDERKPERQNVVRLFDAFSFGRRYCLVFEPLGLSLYDLLKRNNFRGFYMQDLEIICKGALQGLRFCHENGLIHTDIKMENILFVSSRTFFDTPPPRIGNSGDFERPVISSVCSVKLIDFGNSLFPEDAKSETVNTRQYRSPEILLRIKNWDGRSDVFSLGCVFAEGFLGGLLFDTHEEHEHLALIEKILGNFPQDLLLRASATAKRELLTTAAAGNLLVKFPGVSPIDQDSVLKVHEAKSFDALLAGYPDFSDLLACMLALRFEDRCSADQALQAPFFRVSPPRE